MPVRTPFKTSLILAVSLSLPLWAAKVAIAAEINVLSGRGFSPVLDAVVSDFEQKSGHTVKVSYGPGNKIGERVRADEPADLVIIPFPIVNELVKQGKIREGSAVNIARSDVSMSVRVGTLKPNTNSLDAFKQWLLATNSVSSGAPGQL